MYKKHRTLILDFMNNFSDSSMKISISFIFTTLTLIVKINTQATSDMSLLRNTVDLSSFENHDVTIMSTNLEIISATESLFQSSQIGFNSSTSVFPMNFTSFSRTSAFFIYIPSFNETTAFLNQIGKFHYDFIKYSKWSWLPYFFLLVKAPSQTSIEDVMENLRQEFAPKFNVTSSVFLVLVENVKDDENSNSTDVVVKVKTVLEIYHIKNVAVVQEIQFWNPQNINSTKEKRISFHEIAQKTVRRSNFHKADISGINVNHPDFTISVKYKYDNVTRKLEFESGFDVQTFWNLRDALNFTDVAISWNSFIRQGSNGTLTGFAVPINNGLADVIATTVEFLEYRVSGPDGLTFLHPHFHNDLLVFFKQPASSSIRDIFILTFTTELWISMFGIWILIILSLLVSVHVLGRADQNLVHPIDKQLSKDVVLWSICTMSQQGWHISPMSISIKIIFLVGLVTGLMTYVAYSSSLVAILAVEVIPVRTFTDLLDQNFEILSDSHIPTTGQAVRSLEERGIIQTLPNGGRNIEIADKLTELVKKKIAIVSITDSFYQILFTRDERGGPNFACNILSNVRFSRRPAVSSMVVQRGSPLREYFNAKIALMKERGIIHRLRSQYILDTSIQCLKRSGGVEQPLGFKDVFTAFAVLGVGLLSSFTTGLLERFYYMKRIKRKNKTFPPLY